MTGKYEEIGAAIGRLVDKKQKAYGRSLGMVRILDKLFRIATARDALGESPWTDIAGYALLMNSD